MQANLHQFHIPVMGIGFTIDSPIRVAHLGISSVVSIVDDLLLEKVRKHYSTLYQLPYQISAAPLPTAAAAGYGLFLR